LSLRIAWELLTAIPIPLKPKPYRGKMGWAMAWFPFIGVVIGLVLVGSRCVLREFFPAGIESALLLALWAALSGGLHMDGFADCCDGMLVARSPRARLEIMRDSNVGVFGVVGLVLLLLAKYTSLETLPPGWELRALILAPVLGRWAMVWAALRYPLARDAGMGASYREGLGLPEMLFASLTALLFLLLAGTGIGLLSMVAAYVVTTAVAIFAKGRIGGLTGDVYGAVNELVELAVLLVVISAGHVGFL
jgi:adenosylcobinamide-GDP ribazoletransferase